MNDEELHQYNIACFFDGCEDGIEGGLAIDQQFYLVICQAWHATQLGHRPQRCVAFGFAGGKGFFNPRSPVEVGHGHVHFLVGLTPSLDVGIERAGAEDQVGDQGEVGDEEQGHRPRNGTLSCPHGEQRMQCGDYTQQMDQAE